MLWNEKYAGEIYMYDSLRDTMAAALEVLGSEWTSNPIFTISGELLATFEMQRDLGDAIGLYEEQWARVFAKNDPE